MLQNEIINATRDISKVEVDLSDIRTIKLNMLLIYLDSLTDALPDNKQRLYEAVERYFRFV